MPCQSAGMHRQGMRWNGQERGQPIAPSEEENRSRHYSLLKEENERILWSASKIVSLPEMSISKNHRYSPMKNFMDSKHFNETSQQSP